MRGEGQDHCELPVPPKVVTGLIIPILTRHGLFVPIPSSVILQMEEPFPGSEGFQGRESNTY